jgi:hypothetical protein
MSAPCLPVAILGVTLLIFGRATAQEIPVPAPEPLAASATPESEAPAPEPVAELPVALEKGHFTHFLSHSPFQRTLNLEETYALRGIAEIDGVQVATLYNRQTKKSVFVTANKLNAERMQLKEVSDADFLNGVSATITVADEEMSLKFEPERISPGAKTPGGKAATTASSSSSSSGGATAKDIERYKALAPEKQEKVREYIRQTKLRFPEMSREERGNLISGALSRLSEGGDITLPGAPSAPATPPASSSSSGSSSSSPRR